jgi:hypothetical protein
MRIDFSTIVFNDPIELNLLKIQAYSFKFIDPNMINKIFVIYNDLVKCEMQDIIDYYPYEIREKVHVIFYSDMELDISFLNHGWQLQQLLKLHVSNCIETEFYCVLDAKNHFLKAVTSGDLFQHENEYNIFTSPGACVNNFYMENCLSYYGLDPLFYKDREILVSMSTPFIFETNCVKDMISYIETKEETKFETFFMGNKNITEFYIYSAYLAFAKKDNIRFKEIIHTTIHSNPNESWSVYFIENEIYLHDWVKVFGLHRKAPALMSNDYKQSVLKLYNCFYDVYMIEFIREFVLFC